MLCRLECEFLMCRTIGSDHEERIAETSAAEEQVVGASLHVGAMTPAEVEGESEAKVPELLAGEGALDVVDVDCGVGLECGPELDCEADRGCVEEIDVGDVAFKGRVFGNDLEQGAGEDAEVKDLELGLEAGDHEKRLGGLDDEGPGIGGAVGNVGGDAGTPKVEHLDAGSGEGGEAAVGVECADDGDGVGAIGVGRDEGVTGDVAVVFKISGMERGADLPSRGEEEGFSKTEGSGNIDECSR